MIVAFWNLQENIPPKFLKSNTECLKQDFKEPSENILLMFKESVGELSSTLPNESHHGVVNLQGTFSTISLKVVI